MHLHVLDRDRDVAAEQLDGLFVLFVKAVAHLALEAQGANQLPADEQRDAKLAFRVGQTGQRNPT